ncbi:hypothetical protein [Ferrimonas aestuarii]|uniref:Uncharacterized protein n=1 Tax=Ferrimonas aestuarii TaxID=2569539 RepID=A0A4U1BI34_9GAMM|nr:hypothetical protein [Ferrimonas aestuarii]TKB50746.1 hypothetical protein FCL42_19050 [Ferrimonas aestuarii]
MKLTIATLLLVSTHTFAIGGLGGNPGAASGAVQVRAAHCFNAEGVPIYGSEVLKKQRQCPITGVLNVDIINSDNYYGNEPKGETLSDLRRRR